MTVTNQYVSLRTVPTNKEYFFFVVYDRAGKAGVLNIYMENQEIPVGKSNGTHHSTDLKNF